MRYLRLIALVFLAALLGFGSAQAMTFQITTAGGCEKRQCLLATGAIDKTSVEIFRQAAAVNRLRESALIIIDSSGGDLTGGIALGEEIRKRGFDTFVAGVDPTGSRFVKADCASACFFMFIGGVRRGASHDSRLGVHQLTLNNPGTPAQAAMSAQWHMGIAAKHIHDMGVDPEVMALALTMPADQLRWLSRKELRSANIITLDNGLERPSDLGVLSFFDVARQP